MNALHTFASASAVASCTLAAAHRRDHDHGVEVVACHPHVVEVVHLGEHAAMICHDCRTDSGSCRTARPSGWLPPTVTTPSPPRTSQPPDHCSLVDPFDRLRMNVSRPRQGRVGA